MTHATQEHSRNACQASYIPCTVLAQGWVALSCSAETLASQAIAEKASKDKATSFLDWITKNPRTSPGKLVKVFAVSYTTARYVADGLVKKGLLIDVSEQKGKLLQHFYSANPDYKATH